MWTTTPESGTFEPGFYIDTERKVLANQRSVNNFHYAKYFNTGFTRRRPDLSDEEFQKWVIRFGEAEKLKIELAAFAAREAERTGYLLPRDAGRWAQPLAEMRTRLPRQATGYLNFNYPLTWLEMSRAVNWYDAVLDRVAKYGLPYPASENFLENLTLSERAAAAARRQDEVKALMLREMGVDWSVLK